MQPAVDLTILDGGLGIIPPTNGDVLAIVGPASSGPLNTPAAFARGKDVQTNFTSGLMVEAAALLIQLTGKPVVVIRTNTTTPGTTTGFASSFAGTAVPSIDASTVPDDDYEVYLQVVAGGVLGTPGVTYQWSLDDGRTLSAVTALGAALTITIPTPAGLVKIDLQAPASGIIAAEHAIRAGLTGHFIDTAGGIHLAADTTDHTAIAALPVSSTLAGAISNLNAEAALFATHEASTTYHTIADVVNVVTASVATDANSALALILNMAGALGVVDAHFVDLSVHGAADHTNTIAVQAPDPGTILAGDSLSFRAVAPAWANGDLSSALTALGATKQTWNIALIVGPSSASAVEVLDAFFISLKAQNKFKYGIAGTRGYNIGETDAQYQTALGSAFSSTSTLWVDVSAGSEKLISAISSRQYRRPVAWIDAYQAITLDPGQDLAEVDVGPLPSCQIADANGNPDDHDESVYPGLDDQRFTTLRSLEGYTGVYINNGRMFAPLGSDFIFVQFRRVMNLACAALVAYLTKRLSKQVTVYPPGNSKAGLITEKCARSIEAGATQAMWQATGTRRASFVTFVLSRTDDVLSTFTLTGDARVVPIGYTKIFQTTIGFNNPALRISTSV